MPRMHGLPPHFPGSMVMRESNCSFNMTIRLYLPFPAASARFGMDVLRHTTNFDKGEAGAGVKTSETVTQKIFDELPVP
jgi:hypothetical protein